MLALVAMPTGRVAAANPLVVSGTIDDSDIYANPSLNGGCTTFAGDFWHDVIPFYVDTSGTYTLTDNFVTIDASMGVYSQPFDPSNVTAGCVAVVDDLGAANLSANTQYYLVVTTWFPSTFGPYQVTISGPGDIKLGSPGGGCGDDRINQNCSAPAAVYCDGTSYDIYSVDADGNGTLAFSFDANDFTSTEGGHVLVGSANGVDVYYLPESGQFQVHAYQSDGKLYTFLWSSCVPGGDAEFSEYE